LATVRDVRVERGDRVAIIGPNGSGKTTLLRTILGEIPPVDGEVEQGIGVSVGYYAQAHEALDPSNSVLEELLRHRDVLPAQARSHLAQYLFRGEDVYKPVGGLSGGERSRLVLAILSLEGVNLLLLDEPTNHLDIPAQEVLQEGLEHFEGTILLVSHDRYLIDELATQIWVIHEGTIEVFKGTYREYLEAEERRARPVEQPVGVAARDERAAHSNGFDKRERKRLRRLERLEEEIAGAEQALAICQRSLEECSDAGNLPDLRRLTSELAERQARLDDLLGQWEELAEDQSA
jgi:ATP-binding cassette subfamily F protein 3